MTQPTAPRLLSRAVLTACLLSAAPLCAADAPKADPGKPGELLKQSEPAAKAPVAPSAALPSPIKWQKTKLSEVFFSEGAAAGDFNKDGKMDVVSGPYWYAGPDFSPDKKHAYYEPKPYDPNAYSENFFAFVYDFNADGWDDILIYGFPGKDASWYENPKVAAGTDAAAGGKPWVRHKVLDVVDNESPTFADVNGDGKPDIVCGSEGTNKDGGRLGYATADWSDPAKPWTFHGVTPRHKGYQRFTHGLGVGDVNGDGKPDLIEKDGWWEQPKSLAGDPEWKKHPQGFGAGGAQMYAYDVNGDGRNDVITSLNAHNWGLAWFEQDADGSFKPHLIMTDKPEGNPQRIRFSQPHAVDLVDVDGDGLKDIVTGKRYWAHGPKGDAEPNAAAVLYWFKLVRTKDGDMPTASFVGHQIDNDSGIGTQVMAVDLNGDRRPDVVVGNKKGTFVHVQERGRETSRRD